MIVAPASIVGPTAATMVACGAGRRECVVYWLALRGSDTVVEWRHPRHTASATGYEVDGAWLTELFLELGAQGSRVVAQLHTHPGGWVGHSGIDDGFAVLPVPGLVSIVVPRFATGGIQSSGSGIFVLTDTGTWRADPASVQWT
jgi:hypothetical protein